MKIVLKTPRVCAGRVNRPGDVLDLPEPEALRLVHIGAAEPVRPVETAALRTGTREVKRRTRKRKTIEA